MKSVRVAAILGTALLAVACSDDHGTTEPDLPPAPSAAASAMLAEVPSIVTWAIGYNQGLLPRNPQSTSYINAKISLLQKDGLADDIVNKRYFAESTVHSSNGGAIPIIVVFPTDSMRARAKLSVQAIEKALPILESFIGIPFPNDRIRIWYGFSIGNLGGGGALYMEDEGTYDSRTASNANLLPYEAILDHELSHSYIGNEALNQFLEVYVYNRVHGASTNVLTWTLGRMKTYSSLSATNTGVAAVVDIYQLIGPQAMMSAYKALYALQPAYGQPLSAEAKQVFIDRATADVRAQVAEKVEKI